MDGIIPKVGDEVKRRLEHEVRLCRDAGLKTRYLIVLSLLEGRSPSETARVLKVAAKTVYRVAARFRDEGELGLLDRREDNGEEKLDERYLAILYEVVKGCPEPYGWPRSTWTREMLVETMRELTGVTVHVATMSKALKRLGARRGRPRPTVGCPWDERAKARRLKGIQDLLARLPEDEVAVYEDEVDIHLNPKIGLDWMVPGQQKEVLTPGQNIKRYLAGAKDARTGEVIWVEGERKSSDLFVALLWRLTEAYPEARVIHVIVDNYRIHSSRITQQALAALGGRVVLHFLPPYCPNDNKIERFWQDLHANVTRNHRCKTMEELMKRVRAFMRKHSRHGRRGHKHEYKKRHNKRAA